MVIGFNTEHCYAPDNTRDGCCNEILQCCVLGLLLCLLAISQTIDASRASKVEGATLV